LHHAAAHLGTAGKTSVMFKLARSCLVFVFGVLVSVTGARVDAAELRVDPSHPSGTRIVLEGKIEAADFERFKKFILDSGHVTEIYLASPGGNLAEAVKIGILVRLLKLSTVVPSKQLTHYDRDLALARHGLKDSKDYTCASACFFIFVAGIYRSTDTNGPAILGIHSPTLSPADLAKLAPDQANAAIDHARKFIDHYLKIMNVPAKYAEEIYSVPKNKIRWIRNDEFESDFAGFIPELTALAKGKCENRFNETGQRTEKRSNKAYTEHDCTSELRDELAVRALKDSLKRQNGESSQSIFKLVPQTHPN
jgi:hypothetical protein